MTEKLFVKPAAGRLVRDPVTLQALSDDGAEVTRSSYWLRRLRDGDVEAMTKPPAVKDKPSAKTGNGKSD